MDDSSFYMLADAASGSSEAERRADAALRIRFEWMDVPDAAATKESGFPRFKRREMVRIRIPGSQDERVERVNEGHKRRFPRAYAAFQQGSADTVDGTPLREWGGLTADDVSVLNSQGVASVEQLAALSDEHLSGLGHGGRSLRARAKTWVDARATHEPVAKLQAQLDAERQEKEALKERLAKLEAHMLGTAPLEEAPAPRRRGRPPKKPEATE